MHALILGSTPAGEGDKRVCVLSAEHGVLWARAKSVREERSKLRYSLLDYTHAYVSLVRGKAGWRITGAISLADIPTLPERAVFARLARLVQRLTMPHAEGAERVYAPLVAAHHALAHPLVDGTAPRDEIEMLTALRVLFALGYVAPRGEYARVLEDDACDADTTALIGGRRALVLADINKALAESQL